MPGPWEKYQQSTPLAPWEKYAQADPNTSVSVSPPPVAGAGPMGTPSLPGRPSVDMQPSLLGRDAVPGIPTNVVRGAVKGALHTAATLGPNMLIGKTPQQAAPTFAPLAAAAVPNGTAQKIGMGVEQAAEFLAPGAIEEGAFARLSPYVGEAAPVLKAGLAALGSGAVNKAQGGSFGMGAVAGGVGSAVGQGLAAIAPNLAESALKVTGNDRTYGRTVGRAILDDTRGITPEAVDQSARNTMGLLRPQVERLAAEAGDRGGRGSLAPAREAVSDVVSKHTTNRAVNSAAELAPLQDFLKKDALTKLPLAESQSPTGLLQLKRGLDQDFIGNWNPNLNTNNELDTAKQAYGKLADQFHFAAPGTKELDQRMSSLFPVVDRAQRAARGAGIIGETLNRFRTPTGALVGAAGGGAEGYRRDGLTGALIGGAAGAILPSVVASPEAQMIFARTSNVAPAITPSLTGLALQLGRKPRREE